MAEKNGIPYQKTGKLIVAASDREVIDLEKFTPTAEKMV